MNKDTFFKALKKKLRKLKSAEIQKNISYYDELILDMMENGLSEQEALEKIGSPDQIALEILENTAPENFRKKDRVGLILIGVSILALILSLIEAIRRHLMADLMAVSIIGGADGPTSIYLVGKISWPGIYGIAAFVVAVTILYFLWRKMTKR